MDATVPISVFYGPRGAEGPAVAAVGQDDTIPLGGGPVASAKQTVRAVLKGMPDDCTLEDIQYQLYLRQRLEKSREAAAEGRVTPHDEVKKRLGKWVAR